MAAKPEFIMALDAGTGAARCFLISLDGRTSYDVYHEWQYRYPQEAQPGGCEFDPAEFWDIFSGLIRRALLENDISSSQVVGISSTSQREGIVLLDRDGRELYGGPNVDMRSPTHGERIAVDFGQDIYTASGHWPFPMFAPYRLKWFAEHRPDIYGAIDCMLLINDWILYRLSGARASEPTNANETLMLDLRTRQWNRALIERFGFPAHIFPQVVPSGTRIGEVSRQAAEATGLRAGTPVVTGGADTQCALLGTGSIAEGQVSTALGTFAPSQMVVRAPVIDPRHRAWSGCHVTPDGWVVESTAMEAGQAFRWVRDVFYGGGSTEQYSLMDQEAAQSPLGARGVQAFIGPRMPDYTHLKFNVRGGFFFDLPPAPGSASRADFARAVLESIAFGVRANIERMQAITRVAIKSLSICGGVSKSYTFREALANVMNIPVFVPEQKEGSAMGAALCAGVGIGRAKTFAEAVTDMVHWECKLEPQVEKVEQYETLYQRWLPLLPQVHGQEGLGEIE